MVEHILGKDEVISSNLINSSTGNTKIPLLRKGILYYAEGFGLRPRVNLGSGALCHHERYDGKGYPNGISGEEIPMIARIICVSDAFDAMNSKRCYRDSLSEDVIISELENNKGTQFHPRVIESLLTLIDKDTIKFTYKNK